MYFGLGTSSKWLFSILFDEFTCYLTDHSGQSLWHLTRCHASLGQAQRLFTKLQQHYVTGPSCSSPSWDGFQKIGISEIGRKLGQVGIKGEGFGWLTSQATVFSTKDDFDVVYRTSEMQTFCRQWQLRLHELGQLSCSHSLKWSSRNFDPIWIGKTIKEVTITWL